MENRFENFTIAIIKLYRTIQKIKQYEMREFDLKGIHVMCVYYLSGGNGLTAGELSRLMYEDKAAVSRALKLLRDRGYVEYGSKKYNELIRLTPEGGKVAEYIALKSEKAVNAGGVELSDEERYIFYRSLDSISENLNKYYTELISND